MPRIIQEQQNLWGSRGGLLEPQRADLWTVDFRQVIAGLNPQVIANPDVFPKLPDTLESFYAVSVTLPSLVIKPEEVRRGSRPYKMPAFDDSLDEIRISFIFDSVVTATESKVYKVLDIWRAFVRAGRGSMGHEGSVMQLNKYYRIDYAFNIVLTLLRGSSSPMVDVDVITNPNAVQTENESQGVTNDLEQTTIYLLENAWLGNFRISELNYRQGNEIVKIDAGFYAENILNRILR